MGRFVHPNAAELAPGPSVVLARPHPATWALPFATGVLFLVFLLLPWSDVGSRLAAPAFAGTVFVLSLSLATSRWEAQGPLLVGVGTLVVHSLVASQLASVGESRGVQVRRLDGTALSLGALTYRYQLSRGGRAARRVGAEAAAIRAWAAAHREEELPPGMRPVTVDPRWGACGGVLLVCVVGPLVSLAVGMVQ